MSDSEFAGKVAIVTGATRGIGKATAWRLAKSGASVAICSSNEKDVAATLAEAEAAGLSMAGMALALDGTGTDSAPFQTVKASMAGDLSANGSKQAIEISGHCC